MRLPHDFHLSMILCNCHPSTCTSFYSNSPSSRSAVHPSVHPEHFVHPSSLVSYFHYITTFTLFVVTNLSLSCLSSFTPSLVNASFNTCLLHPFIILAVVFILFYHIIKIIDFIVSLCPVQVLFSTVQYSTVQYSTVQYSTVQYSTVQYSTVQYSGAIIIYSKYIANIHYTT